jgi:GNAT superfamily N-acetyltransferase
METVMAETAYETAWRRENPKHAADAVTFWTGGGMLPADLAERRAKDLCSMAYADGKLIGVSTVELQMAEPLRSRLAFYRCAVAPEFRRQSLAIMLTRHTIITMEGWSHENPGEKVNGVATVLQGHELDEKALNPVWGEYYGNLNFIGFTPAGAQIRVAWFRHARLEAPAR